MHDGHCCKNNSCNKRPNEVHMCTVNSSGRHGIPATENNRREHPFRENFEQEMRAFDLI